MAGEETFVALPEYNVTFDAGRAPREIISIDNLCLSHGHMDHAAGIAYYLSQRGFVGNAPGRIIVHRDLARPIQKLMDIWSDIEGHPIPGQIYGVEPLEDVPLRRNLFVRPFAVNHAANALGFTLIDVRHKLKPEFHGKSGPELVALKRRGMEIEHRVENPLFTYTGDTAIGRFLNHDFVRKSKSVALECTFFDPEHLSRAEAGRHIHVRDLTKILEAIPDARVLLTHVTKRTDLRTARRFLERAVNSSELERIMFLMERTQRSASGHELRPTPRGKNEFA